MSTSNTIGTGYSVDLETRTCSCFDWQDTYPLPPCGGLFESGQLLGYLTPALRASPTSTSVFLSEPVPYSPTQDLDDFPLPGELPPPLKSDPPLSADISRSFGVSYASKIQSILDSHSSLFQPQFGTFQDGISMPIDFQANYNLRTLSHPPPQGTAGQRRPSRFV